MDSDGGKGTRCASTTAWIKMLPCVSRVAAAVVKMEEVCW